MKKHKRKLFIFEKLLSKKTLSLQKVQLGIFTALLECLFDLIEVIEAIQTTKPSWAIKSRNKLVDLEDRSRRNNLRINGIKERKNETWIIWINCL